MIPQRRYRDVSPELRTAAVKSVALLQNEVSSRWRAIQLVAEATGVHPNTLRNWSKRTPTDPDPRAATSNANCANGMRRWPRRRR